MLEDIAPDVLKIEYTPCVPENNSLLCLFSGAQVLACENGQHSFALPRFGRAGVRAEDCRFLFRLGKTACFLVDEDARRRCVGFSLMPLRKVMSFSPQAEAFAAMTAYHLAQWYRANRFCGCCGQAMHPGASERSLVCPACQNTVYPRINPAIIVGVIDGERLLLTRYAPSHASSAFYALIAGFCEIGERAEDTVRREVMEEVGLRVKNIRYYASQPWGIDGNLSLGYFADLDGSDCITLERDELCEAVWAPRGEIPDRGNTLALTTDMMRAFADGVVK